MKTSGHGTTAITARAGIPLPKSTSSGRTIWDDLERARSRPTGFAWPEVSYVEPAEVIEAKKERAKAARAPRLPRKRPSQATGARLGPVPTMSEADVEKMKALYEAKHGLIAIAEQFGCSKTTIRKYLINAGVELLPPGRNRVHENRAEPDPRVCVKCAVEFTRRSDESHAQFAKRKTCSRRCAASLGRGKVLSGAA